MSDYREQELTAARVGGLLQRLKTFSAVIPEQYETRSYLAGYLAGKDEAVRLLETTARALEISERAAMFGDFTIPHGYGVSYEADRVVVTTPGGGGGEIRRSDLEGVVKALLWAYDLHRGYA